MFLTLFSSSMIAENKTTYKVPMRKEQNKTPDQQLDYDGRRLPPQPIICTINENDVITDIPSEEIISYELWNNTGDICIISCSSTHEFIEYLFSFPDNYQIKIVTEDFCLVGYISTI